MKNILKNNHNYIPIFQYTELDAGGFMDTTILEDRRP
jgi:hypothetical protein